MHHRDFSGRERFDAALAEAIDSTRSGPGGARRLHAHPHQPDSCGATGAGSSTSTLPCCPTFRGWTPMRGRSPAGAGIHGATVHFVTEELDGGPIIAQARVPVLADDDPDTLAARVLEREHVILPRTLAWFAARRVSARRGPRPHRRRARAFSPRGLAGGVAARMRIPGSRSLFGSMDLSTRGPRQPGGNVSASSHSEASPEGPSPGRGVPEAVAPIPSTAPAEARLAEVRIPRRMLISARSGSARLNRRRSRRMRSFGAAGSRYPMRTSVSSRCR